MSREKEQDAQDRRTPLFEPEDKQTTAREDYERILHKPPGSISAEAASFLHHFFEKLPPVLNDADTLANRKAVNAEKIKPIARKEAAKKRKEPARIEVVEVLIPSIDRLYKDKSEAEDWSAEKVLLTLLDNPRYNFSPQLPVKYDGKIRHRYLALVRKAIQKIKD